MTEIRYGGIYNETGGQVTGMGSQPGPTGGDGWQIVGRLPAAQLPAGTGRYAVLVSGRISFVQVSGAVPVTGVIQVCLGTTGGSISPLHEQRIAADEVLPQLEGIPFQFAMVMNASPAISDPFFGATWNNSAGSDFCIYARTFWNLDPAVYAVTFEISDLHWLWWDTDRIPSTDVLCERYAPAAPVALTTTLSGLYLNTNSPGAAAEQWLHFFNVVYRPRGMAALNHPAPTFRFGFSPTPGSFTGFTAKVGTNGRWGQQRGAGSPIDTRLHQGGFWCGVQPAGTFLPAVMAADRQAFSGSTSTLVERYTYVGVRLDHLLDVLVRTDEEVAGAAVGLLNNTYPWPTVYVPLERPATGVVSEPSVLVHGIVQTSGRQAFEAAITTNRGLTLASPNSMSQADASRSEGVSSMAFGIHGLSAGQPDVQYRVHFLGGLTAPPLPVAVRDLTIVQFNFVRDPSNIIVIPADPGNPIIIVPGKESADPGALLPPPTAPDAATQEGGKLATHTITGATGYRRGWPAFVKNRRTFSLTWSVLTAAQADAMMAFLAANPAFRYTPPRAAAIAVVQMARPELQTVSGHVYGISLQVSELILTG